MKIFGIPFSVDLSFFMIVGFLGMDRFNEPIRLVQWIVVVFASVLVHEMGHALAGRAFGLAPQVQLYGMGGLTSWSGGRDVGPARHIAISLAGPFAGFALGALGLATFFATGHGDQLHAGTLLWDILWVNVGWGLLNLLPMLPLDGGNVVRSAIELVTRRSADRAAQLLSIAIAALVALLAFRFGSLWGAFLAMWFGYSNVTALLERRHEDEDEGVVARLDDSWHEIEEGRGAASVGTLEQLGRDAKSKSAKRRVAEALVYAHLQARDAAAAQKAYGVYAALHGKHPYLEAAVALESGDAERAVAILEPLLNDLPVARIARELCRAYVRSGRADKALALCSSPSVAAFATDLFTTVCEEAYRAGRFDVSAEAGSVAAERTRDPMIAYNVACALARAGREDKALSWLSRAVDFGFADQRLIATDADLDALRSHPELVDILRRLETIEGGPIARDPADSQVP